MADINVEGEWVNISSTFRYKKIGSIVFLEFIIPTASGWATLATLPSAIRPPIFYESAPNITFTVFQGAGSSVNASVQINPTTGIVRSYNTDNGSYHVQYSYVI